MRAPLKSDIMRVLVLVVGFLHHLSYAWPHNHRNKHGYLHHHVHRISASSGSSFASIPTTLPILTKDAVQNRNPFVTRQVSSLCPDTTGTIYTSAGGKQYTIVCNINIPGQDYPFELVGSFDNCVTQCDSINAEAGSNKCLAALFISSRELYANDCYLKRSIENLTQVTRGIEGAILITGAEPTLPISSASSLTQIARVTSTISSPILPPSSTASHSVVLGGSIWVSYAAGSSVVTPCVVKTSLHGPTQNQPSTQFMDWKAPADLKLAVDLLSAGVDGNLSTGYAISPDTGILLLNESTQSYLANVTDTPHISRDGGKGGYLNGQHLFVFSDTGSYTTTTASSNGNFLGFVSSSVAIDTGRNGLDGNALVLEDGIGQWSDSVGRMRGFAPMTQGEQSYNLVMQGEGLRYAIWPESSIIPLDTQNAILYAPIVYDDVNMQTKAAVFTYTGTTLLTVTAPGPGGPFAERTSQKLFYQDEVEWGCIGGIRSWGPSGIGGTDGSVYLFGNVAGGLLLARTSHDSIADRDSYMYWTGSGWANGMQTSNSIAYLISGAFMDADLFYSPRHLTFIIVYMTTYADSTFYYRYLDASQSIVPPFGPGGDNTSDYVENIVKYSWSEEQVLYKASPGLGGKYAYSGGVHQGYYGTDDITNGGSKMLISWTSPTGLDPSSDDSEYQIITAEVDWA